MTTPPPPPGGGQPPFQPNQPPAGPPQPGYPQQPPPPAPPPQQGQPPQGYPQQPPQPGYPPQQPQQGYQQPNYAPPTGGFAPPPAPSYATPPPASQHKLSGKLIATAVAAVVIVAGGVGAAFALSGGSSSPAPSVSSAPAPPPPQPHTTSAPPSSTPPSSEPPSSAPPSSQAPSSTPPSSTPPSTSDTNSVQVAGPVYITPGSGWELAKRGSGYVIFAKGGTSLLVDAYRASSGDVTRELISGIESYTKGTTGLKLGTASPPTRIHGKNFTQLRLVRFQFELSTQQGTATITGLFVEFLNPRTHIAAFCVYSSPSISALNANNGSALAMISSIE